MKARHADIYAVVMAGGRGERFWPRSRAGRPKQLLRLFGGATLLEATVGRLRGLVPPARTLVVTGARHAAAVRALLPGLPAANVIGEPVGRDTAACAALAAGVVWARAGDARAVVLMLPADHLVRDAAGLRRTLSDCVALARQGHLVTVGIPPSGPSPAYGYLRCGKPLAAKGKTRFLRGEGFVEKPAVPRARALLRGGRCRWNSGMFVWSVGAFLAELERQAPALAAAARAFRGAAGRGRLGREMAARYPRLPQISIDHAVMERARDVAVAAARFDWDDVGSWGALGRHFRADRDGNVVQGRYAGLDSRGCLVLGDDRHLVATIGVRNLIVVRSGDATLICDRGSDQRLKELMAKLAADRKLRGHL